MSMLRMTSICFAAASLLTVVGCQNKVHDDNLALHQQNRELQSQLSEKDDRLRSAPDPAQLASMQKDIADRDAKIRELQTSLTRPAAGAPADPTLAGIETSYDSKAGTITVNLPSDVLFDSGKAILKPTALGSLDKIVAAVRKDYSHKPVQVNGFTDSDNITKSKDQWADNWDLSYARAKAVMQYLTAHGVDGKLVTLAANGSNKPKSTKPASRRVEIVVSAR